MGLVVPAVLPSSKQELNEGLALFARISSISRVQIDVVDGKFVSPASWPYADELQKMIKRGEMLPNLHRFEYEIDLMCLDAEIAAETWLALGATRLVFHAESSTNLPRLLASARRRYGHIVSFGIALNIASDLALIEPCLGEIDFVQCMGIAHIGRQGQPFDSRVFGKVRVCKSRHPEIPVQVDGGISFDSARELVALGVSNIIIGSAILRAINPAAVVAAFEELQSPYGI
jgi:ribulose-phosphate 3-epimerase